MQIKKLYFLRFLFVYFFFKLERFSAEALFVNVIDDEVLEALSGCKKLILLYINGNSVTIKGFENILKSIKSCLVFANFRLSNKAFGFRQLFRTKR